MEVQYLLMLVALLIAVWLVSSQISSVYRNRRARQSREKLRSKAAERTLAGRLFSESRASEQKTPLEQNANVQSANAQRANAQSASVQSASVQSASAQSASAQSASAQSASAQSASVQSASAQDDTAVITVDYESAELRTLRDSLQEKDQTILQLQQVLEELTSTTATRESVNILQKKLIASRAKVLQQEGELKQLRVEMGKRRPPVAMTSVQVSDESELKPSSSQNTQSNESIKAQDRAEDERAEDQPEPANRRPSVKPLFVTQESRDDLKLIKGIGPVLERRLNELGVTTFDQLAGFTEQDVERVSLAIAAFPGRIEREDWVGKARELAAEKSYPA